jgi:hypothetical protein
MPFPPFALDSAIVTKLCDFAKANSFVQLYKSYSWQNDTYQSGFPDIHALESTLTRSDLSTGITLDNVKAVAEWGRLPNLRSIVGQAVVAPPYTFHALSGATQSTIERAPLGPLDTISRGLTKGVGPTYISKVLRFSLPQEYGSIDTRCVRVFGSADRSAPRHGWLNLRASVNDQKRWYINKKQSTWPSDYANWVNILRYFASALPSNCPHPARFVESGLRTKGLWLCADIEMALFAYASQQLDSKKR